MIYTRLGVYTVILAGWSSNSNYALLGGLRRVAQTISYEVSIALILLSFVFLIANYNIVISRIIGTKSRIGIKIKVKVTTFGD